PRRCPVWSGRRLAKVTMTSPLASSNVADVQDVAPHLTAYDDYPQLVRLEMRRLRGYFAKQMRWYRAMRAVLIVRAALVPVLAATGPTPRWVLGALGGAAAITEALQSLFQFRATALNAMKTANSLERVLNRYMTATPPFHEKLDKSFPMFVDEIETI